MAESLPDASSKAPPLPKKKGRRPSVSLVPSVGDAMAVYNDEKVDARTADQTVVKSRRKLRATTEIIGAALMDKMLRGKKSPVDSKVAMFLAAGTGLTQKGSAVTEEERRAMDAENERLDAMPVEDLSKKVHFLAGIEPVPEPAP